MRADIVAEARLWLGTPYVHQAGVRGVGCDCLGLFRGIWRKFYGDEPDALPAYTSDWGEIGGLELLLQAARRHLRPAQIEAPGDLLVFRMRTGAIAKHLAVQAESGLQASFIHAYDRHGVVESPLTQPWRARIAGRFVFPPISHFLKG